MYVVDDEKVLRQLATEIAAGKLELLELKSLDLDAMGRGKRRKYKPEKSDNEDTDNEVYCICYAVVRNGCCAVVRPSVSTIHCLVLCLQEQDGQSIYALHSDRCAISNHSAAIWDRMSAVLK